jgi:hydroxymethylpyrimidine/phosphomethylpyrimidine kinase
MKKVLTIAGSDCSGGAGIQADLKTMSAHKVYGMSVITALTAQNTLGVTAILDIGAGFVGAQIDAILEDIMPDAIKIGMLSKPEVILAVAEKIRPLNIPIVVDPVMVSTTGSKLLEEDAHLALIEVLFPLATLITPNVKEAEVLSGMQIHSKQDKIAAAKKILNVYNGSLLLKGGHATLEEIENQTFSNIAQDLLFIKGKYYEYNAQRVDNPNNHGTGCTLSSAIACNLAKGDSLQVAIGKAKDYITGALNAQLAIGKGSGPLNHSYQI